MPIGILPTLRRARALSHVRHHQRVSMPIGILPTLRPTPRAHRPVDATSFNAYRHSPYVETPHEEVDARHVGRAFQCLSAFSLR